MTFKLTIFIATTAITATVNWIQHTVTMYHHHSYFTNVAKESFVSGSSIRHCILKHFYCWLIFLTISLLLFPDAIETLYNHHLKSQYQMDTSICFSKWFTMSSISNGCIVVCILLVPLVSLSVCMNFPCMFSRMNFISKIFYVQ